MMYDEPNKFRLPNKNAWSKPGGIYTAGIILVILLLIIASTIFVYSTGGIKYVYAHTMYIPILLAAFFFRIPGGIITGILGGLALGPYMPIDVISGELQPTVNWLYRLEIFVLVGAISGSLNMWIKNQLEHFKWLSLHDQDTRLPNRNHLLISLDRSIAKHGGDSCYALITLLLINHSSIIDLLGVEEVRTLSEEVSKRIGRILHVESLHQLFPYILCVFLPIDNPDHHLKQIIDSILGDLKQPFEIKGMDIYVDVTLGISLFPMHGSTSSVLLRKAKIASHISSEKHLPYFIYEHETASRMEASQKLLGNVPTALAENQFQLHYQPIVRLSDGHIVGLESLIRWQHPDMGSIPPLDFIPTLERSSLIREVNDWVMTTAVNDLDYFSSGGFEGSISINISSRTLFNSSWLNRLEDILKTTSVDPSRIVFEITETAIIIDPEMTSTHVNRLCNSGTSIALDDFGSGYASLEAVRQLPINYLKIDRKFTQNLTNSREDQEIITAAITLSNAMKDEVIAEGVETQETYDWLKTADCEYAQGYFICRPGPKEEITQFMEKYQPQVE